MAKNTRKSVRYRKTNVTKRPVTITFHTKDGSVVSFKATRTSGANRGQSAKRRKK